MELESEGGCPTKIVPLKTFQFRCPCKQNKCHLGIFVIIPKESELLTKLCKVQKEFYLGHGIKTTDPVEAAKIFLFRDHEKLANLLSQYFHVNGKLGVYMVPPMFYGEVPEAITLSESRLKKSHDKIRGDFAERKMFYALKKYFSQTGEDVVIVHSHKFLNQKGNNEKDFIVFNLTKDMYMKANRISGT